MDMNTIERLLMPHTIEHMFSRHAYVRALRPHFLTAASLTALVLDESGLMDEIDVRRLLYMFTVLFCNVPVPPPVSFRKIPSKSQLRVRLY